MCYVVVSKNGVTSVTVLGNAFIKCATLVLLFGFET